MKKIISILFSLCMLFGISSCKPSKQTASPSTRHYTQISAKEAKARMDTEEDYILLDVRTQAEYEEGHIPGALLLPNETIGTDAIPLLPDKDQLILVYCRSGNRSKDASHKLAEQGYTNVYEFGGIQEWPYDIE